MSSSTTQTERRFYPYQPHPDDTAGCETLHCANAATWWEETANLLLCDACAVALVHSSSPLSLLEHYQQVMLYAADLIVKHPRECATCTRLVPLLPLRAASMAVAECIAQSDGIAWAVHDRLVSLYALAELAEVHLRDKKR